MSMVRRRILIDGELYRSTYVHRLRVTPEGRGGMATAATWEGFSRNALWNDFPYSFVAAGNEAMLRTVPPQQKWEVRPERVVIATARYAGARAHGREATPADASRVVALLNATHDGAQLFVPYTIESRTERMTREPALYSWRHLRLSDRAVVGVWPPAFRVLRSDGEEQSSDVRSLVLDYACEPGAELELVELIRAWCGELCESGSTELTIFTSPGLGPHEALRDMGKRVEPYVAVSRVIPADLSRGVYVDQLYL